MTRRHPDRPATEDAAAEAATDAFALVGNEIRAGILHALGDADDGESSWRPLSFSDLRARVDPALDSSQFNYHLKRLRDRFVEKTDDGYRLRPAGMKLYRAIRAGSYTEDVTIDATPVGASCFACGGPLVGTYDRGIVEIQCADCDRVFSHTFVPPSALTDVDDPDAAFARVDQYKRHKLHTRANGVCTVCGNELDARLVDPSAASPHEFDTLDVMVHRPCPHCGTSPYFSVGLALLAHPAVVSFWYDHGVDVTTTPIWELEFAMTDRHTTVRARDPWTVALELDADGDSLTLVVDDDLSVTVED